MSPPSPEEEDAALTGTAPGGTPATDLDRAMLRLRLVAEAKSRGVSWAAIGLALGCDGKAAKRYVKRFAARTQHDLLLLSPAVDVPLDRDGQRDQRSDQARTPPQGAVPSPSAARKRQHQVRRRGR